MTFRGVPPDPFDWTVWALLVTAVFTFACAAAAFTLAWTHT